MTSFRNTKAFTDCTSWYALLTTCANSSFHFLYLLSNKAGSCCRDTSPAPWWRNAFTSFAHMLCLIWQGHLIPCKNLVSILNCSPSFYTLWDKFSFLWILSYHKSSVQTVTQLSAPWPQQLAIKNSHLRAWSNQAQSDTVIRYYLLKRLGQSFLRTFKISPQHALSWHLSGLSIPWTLVYETRAVMCLLALSLSSRFTGWDA